MGYKESTKQALEKYLSKQIPSSKPKRKNKKPEKEVQEKCLGKLRSMGFSIDVVESKAVYSASAGRYLNSQASVGFSDLVGNDDKGRACFIELKAPGKISTLRDMQRDFLETKIRTNCFAIVVDNEDILMKHYLKWASIQHAGAIDQAKEYLFNLLPQKRDRTKAEKLIESELPF